MNQSRGTPSPRTGYRWPWLVLTALLLGVVLAILWMSFAVRRTRELRDTNPLLSPSQPGTRSE
jgi:hypothetical protein